MLTLLAMIGCATAATAQDFHLKTVDGKTTGPFAFRDGATIQIGDEQAHIVKDLSLREQVLEQLQAIRIPEVDFRQANIRDVVTFLQEASIAFDPEKRGISMILKLDDYGTSAAIQTTNDFFQEPIETNAPSRTSQVLVTFSALDITLKEALDYSVDIAGLKYFIRNGAIMIMDPYLCNEYTHRIYDVDPMRFSEDGPAEIQKLGHINLYSPSALIALFEEWGGDWPGKSSIKYIAGLNKLVVVNTAYNMAMFENLMATLKLEPYQLEIEVHIVAFDTQAIAALGPNGITIEALTGLRNAGQGELLAAPRVLTQSGQPATIKGVTECIYPTEFSVITTGTNTNTNALVTLIEPSDYCTREIGTILEITAEAQPNGNLINLCVDANLTESPVWHQFGGIYTDTQGNTQQANMPQPHFHNYRELGNVLVANGKTVLIGGGLPSRDGKQLVYMFLTARMVGMQGERLWEE